MGELGDKFISGKIVSLDNEKIEKLKEMSDELKKEEGSLKQKIDTMIK